jgi:glycosyltransferase involved in cell wall biosynthesis
VVGDAAVLFDPTETASIAEALIELWSNANLRMDLWARGIRRAQRFTWEDTARQTLDVYRQIVGSTGAGAPG